MPRSCWEGPRHLQKVGICGFFLRNTAQKKKTDPDGLCDDNGELARMAWMDGDPAASHVIVPFVPCYRSICATLSFHLCHLSILFVKQQHSTKAAEIQRP